MKDSKTAKLAAGIGTAVASAAGYGLCSAIMKTAQGEGASEAACVFLISLVSFLILALNAALRRKSVRVFKENIKWYLLAGVVGNAATTLLLNGAYGYLPVGTVTTVHYMYPLVVCLISCFLFKEKLGRGVLFTLVFCLAGMSLFFESVSAQQAKGLLFVLPTLITWPLYLLLIGHSPLSRESATSFSFWMNALATLTALFSGIAAGGVKLSSISRKGLLWLLVAAVIHMLAGIFSQLAVVQIGAPLCSIFGIFEPIASIVFGAVLLRESLTARQILACSIILAGIVFLMVLTYLDSRRSGSEEAED